MQFTAFAPQVPAPMPLSLGQLPLQLPWQRLAPLMDQLRLDSPPFTLLLIGGTNGKGSAVAILERLLIKAGYSVGAFTSPHTHTFFDRIRLQGQPIDQGRFHALACEVALAYRRCAKTPAWFDMLTLIAMRAFVQAGVRVAVLEVGLGGKFDATNAWDAHGAAITSIDLDHTERLGTTLGAIASQKIEIARANRTLVVPSRFLPRNLYQRAMQKGAKVLDASVYYQGPGETPSEAPARWLHPKLSFSLPKEDTLPLPSLLCALGLWSSFFPDKLSGRHISSLLSQHQTPARLQWIKPSEATYQLPVLLDVAHNLASFQRLLAHFSALGIHKPPLVLMLKQGKATRDLLHLIPKYFSAVHLVETQSSWMVSSAWLQAFLQRLDPDLPCQTHLCLDRALKHLSNPPSSGPKKAARGPVVVAGSFLLAQSLFEML